MIYERHARLRVAAIDAWASVKSFKKNQKQEPPDDPGNPTVNFRGEQRRNDTHDSTTDPESRPARKGGTARKPSSLSRSTR